MSEARISDRTQSDLSSIVLLVAIVLLSAVVLYRHFAVAVPPDRDTQFRSGTHVVFVVVAPTSTPSDNFTGAVRIARDSVRASVGRSGRLFSTVGVSDHWNVAAGLEMLSALGPFDEMTVGRNWFNTGIEAYITRLNGAAAVPQVIVLQRNVLLDSLGVHYGSWSELYRGVGAADVESWARAGAILPSFIE